MQGSPAEVGGAEPTEVPSHISSQDVPTTDSANETPILPRVNDDQQTSVDDKDNEHHTLTLEQQLDPSRYKVEMTRTEDGKLAFSLTLHGIFELAPEDMRCPLTLGFPQNPVIIGNQLFEQESLQIVYEKNGRNPLNRQILKPSQLEPNPFAKKLLEYILVECPESYFDASDEDFVANAMEFAFSRIKDSDELYSLTKKYLELFPVAVGVAIASKFMVDLLCKMWGLDDDHNQFFKYFDLLSQPTRSDNPPYTLAAFKPLLKELIKKAGGSKIELLLERLPDETFKQEFYCLAIQSTLRNKKLIASRYFHFLEKIPDELSSISEEVKTELVDFLKITMLAALQSSATNFSSKLLTKFPWLINEKIGGSSFLHHLIYRCAGKRDFLKRKDVISLLFEFPNLDAVSYDDMSEFRVWLREKRLRRRVKRDSDEDRFTPLQLAVYLGYIDVVKLLVQLSVDKQIDIGINLPSQGYHARPPLLIALFKGDLPLVSTVLSHPDADINAKDDEGCTALYRSVDAVNYGFINLIIAARANPFVLGPNETTILTLAETKPKSHAKKILTIMRKTFLNYIDEIIDALCSNNPGFTVPGANGMVDHHAYSVVEELLSLRPQIWSRFVERINSTISLYGLSNQCQVHLARFRLCITDPTNYFYQFMHLPRWPNVLNGKAGGHRVHGMIAEFARNRGRMYPAEKVSELAKQLDEWLTMKVDDVQYIQEANTTNGHV